jgi:hypothetical protein
MLFALFRHYRASDRNTRQDTTLAGRRDSEVDLRTVRNADSEFVVGDRSDFVPPPPYERPPAYGSKEPDSV